MTWVTAVMAGAGAAALLLTASTVIGFVQDEQVRECAAALAAASTAITAHQEAVTKLEYEMDRRVVLPAAVRQARVVVDEASRALDAARDDFTRLCLAEPPDRDA